MAREDLPPDFLQSPLLPGLEVAGNSGFVDSTAFTGRNAREQVDASIP